MTAVEMGATAVVKFKVIKGAGKSLARGPRFRHRDYFAPPEWAAPKRFLAATGMPIRDDGVNEGENLTLACRNALLNMIDLLQERGWTREQGYVISSVAVDLRVSNVVDVLRGLGAHPRGHLRPLEMAMKPPSPRVGRVRADQRKAL